MVSVKRGTWQWVPSLGGALVIWLLLPGCTKSPTADARTEPPVVVVARVAPEQQTAQSFTGVVVARVNSDIGFRVNGKVIERLVNAGQAVKKDQPLMRLDPVDLKLATAMRQAELDAAKAKAVQAIAEELRQTELINHGATSHTLYDTATAAADSARAAVALAEAALHSAQNNDGYTTVYADSDGIIVDTLVEPGQVVEAGQTVLKLAHAGPREAAVFLPETVRPAVGSTADAKLYGGQGHAVGKLRQLSNSADPGTRTYEARYVLDGPSSLAPLGATVTIELSEAAQSVSVPNAAITDRGAGPGVWVVDVAAGTVAFRSVKIDRLGDENALLAGGVAAGEQVVALGAHLLSDGQTVRIAKKETAVQ